MGRLNEGSPSGAARAASSVEWCAEQNAKPITALMGRWYYVAEKDGHEAVTTLDGCDGENVHRLLNGTLPDFMNWPKARMDGYRKWLTKCARSGGYAVQAIQQAA